MYIIWGTKITRKRLGRIADYCPFCDDARACDVREVSSVGHLYYIPLGRRRVIGWESRCRRCKEPLAISNEGPGPRPIKVRRHTTLEELVDQTHPALVDSMAERLDRREALAAGTLDPAGRVRLMIEPLLAVATPIEVRGSQMNFDVWSALSLLLWLVLPFVAWVLVELATGGATDVQVGVAIAVGFGLAAVTTIILIATDLRRFVRRRYRRFLVKGLAPLDPEEDELQQLVDHLGRHGLDKASKALRPARLLRWIEGQ